MNGHHLWHKLQTDLQRQVDDFPGVAGIAVQEPVGGLNLQINGEVVFPAASSIKIPILMELFLKAQSGDIDLSRQVDLPPDNAAKGSGVLAYLHGPIKMSVLDVATLMIIVSDNAATNLCIDWTGLDAVNGLIQRLGLHSLKLRRKMVDKPQSIAADEESPENVGTPIDMARLLLLLRQGTPDPAIAVQTLEILRKPKAGLLNRVIPHDVKLANKPGWLGKARCDVGLVELARRPYAVAVMSKFALCDDVELENRLVEMFRSVYRTLETLNRTNRYGRVE